MGKDSIQEEKDRIQRKAGELVAQMTLEEKAGLCSGQDFWNLKAIERLGLDTIMVCDGPHGLRKQVGDADNLGLGDSLPAVCFPTASALACSFDTELAREIGSAIGEECLQEEVSVLLGPGVNQKRSPLCGRNFEYYSEDPLLSGELAAGMIEGVQSTGVGTSLKHFAVNNQERRRMTINAVVDERAFRELYLKAFEIAVKKGKPRTVMCAYNRLKGEYCSENRRLLTDILRKEWGYEGLVISDWGAVNDRIMGIEAGMDLEMPGSMGMNDAKVVTAVREKRLSEEALDRSACRVAELILRQMEAKQPGYRYDAAKHHELAVRAAEQSAVLLKNEGELLPGNPGQSAAIIGSFAKQPRYQGAGSSKLHPVRVENAYEVLEAEGMTLTYARGYYLGAESRRNASEEEQLIREACEAAKGKDIVYLFAGLPEGYESEGFDRGTLMLPAIQDRLISAVADCNPNVAVILHGGAPMELPWYDKVRGLLLAYLAGEGVGRAAANLLLGKAVPCGKLAETWPLSLTDCPASRYFPGGRHTVEYRESIYVGYRYYETAGKAVRFPFGYGLSYSSFAYSNIILDRESCEFGDKLRLGFTITNQGSRRARETALVFISHRNEKVFQPAKELKAFTKVELEAGESRQISLELDTGEFGYYNTLIGDWYAESGEYQILAGPSASLCSLRTSVTLNSPSMPQPDLRDQSPVYYSLPKGEFIADEKSFSALYGGPLPLHDSKPGRPYDHNNTLEDIEHTLIGTLIIKAADRMARKTAKNSREEEGMMSNMIKEMPFHSLVASGGGAVREAWAEGLLLLLNGEILNGLKKLLKRKA